MTTLFSILLSVTFLFLGFIHFYWLFGGKKGLKVATPTKNDQTEVIPPPKLATLFVALILIFFGGLYLIKAGFIAIHFPSWLTQYGYWVIPSLFILRSIGEFHYVGFFKKIKHTHFAQADTQLFSPLCLIIGLMGICIQLF